jgi:hypothetical protein
VADNQTSDRPVAAHDGRHASTCRWATPTLFLAPPFWFEADNAPWTCVRDVTPHVLDTTEPCAICGRWEPAIGLANRLEP